MDHVASGWNGWKSINIFVPDGETYGVNVVSGALDFFRPILARVVSRGPTICLEGLLRMRGGGWRRMDSGIIFSSGFLLMYLYPFLVSNTAMVLRHQNWERLQMRSFTSLNLEGPPPSPPSLLVYRPIPLPHHLHPPRSHLKKCSKVDPKMR